MPQLSLKAFAKLAQSMAGASDDAIIQAAKQITEESYDAAAKGVRSVRDILESGEDYGILSAANPGRKLSAEENLTRHESLRTRLGELGHASPLEQRGVYGSEPEPSFLVPGLTSDLTKQLGREFEQEAVISSAGWHRLADDTTYPRKSLDFDQQASDYYSELTDPSSGQALKYQIGFPDEAYGPPPTAGLPPSSAPLPEPTAAPTASLPESTSAETVESSPLQSTTAPSLVRLPSQVVKGFGTLAKALRKTDQPGVYELHPQIRDRVLQLTETGMRLPQRANWKGTNDPEFLEGGFGGNAEAAKLWGQLFGATSPGTSVPVNIRESLSTLRYALTHPDEELSMWQAKRMNPTITMAPSKIPNINRIFRGEKMSTPKPDRLGRLQTGEQRVVPWDVHALEGVGSGRETFQQEISDLRTMMTKAEGLPRRGGLTNEQIYERAEQALLKTLDELQPGLPTDPAFAVFWEGVRAHKGLTYQGGPIDVLRKKGLLRDVGMLDPGRLKKVLKSAGWTAGAITAVLKASNAEAQQPQKTGPVSLKEELYPQYGEQRPSREHARRHGQRTTDITLPSASSKAKTAAPMNARVARPKKAA